MEKEYWTITEVMELIDVEEDFLSDLEEEDIVCPICMNDSINGIGKTSRG